MPLTEDHRRHIVVIVQQKSRKAMNEPKIMRERRWDIDWLGVLVMLAVFFFHCARFFGGGTWHLNNAEQSNGVWGMNQENLDPRFSPLKKFWVTPRYVAS